MMDPIIVVFAYMFLVGLLISNVARVFFWFLNRKQNVEFLETVEKHMMQLGNRIDQRASDLQEIQDVVNREYSSLSRDAHHVPPPMNAPRERLARRRNRPQDG